MSHSRAAGKAQRFRQARAGHGRVRREIERPRAGVGVADQARPDRRQVLQSREFLRRRRPDPAEDRHRDAPARPQLDRARQRGRDRAEGPRGAAADPDDRADQEGGRAVAGARHRQQDGEHPRRSRNRDADRAPDRGERPHRHRPCGRGEGGRCQAGQGNRGDRVGSRHQQAQDRRPARDPDRDAGERDPDRCQEQADLGSRRRSQDRRSGRRLCGGKGRRRHAPSRSPIVPV